MTWAKLSRKANKLESELNVKQQEREAAFKASWKSKTLYLLKFRFGVEIAVALLFVPSEVAVITMSSDWLWPLSKLFAYPAPAGSISALSWVFICNRVFNRVAS